MVERGLNQNHFNSVADHHQTTLEDPGVPGDLIGEVMAIAGSTKDDVLGL